MTVGEGIFLSSLVFGLVILFAVTKDRWNWKRLALWSLAAPAALALAIGGGFYGYALWQDRPVAQTRFGDVDLTASKADVRFARGEPSDTDGPERWIYRVGGQGDGKDSSAQYIIAFKEGRIRFVLFTANSRQVGFPSLMGFTIGAPYATVLKKLGQPSSIASSSDELERVLSYDRFNAFFSFTEGHLSDFGIYQPRDGPVAFRSPLVVVPSGGSLAAPRSQSSASSGATPEQRCAGRNPLSHFVCMERECPRGRLHQHPECVAWRGQSRPADAKE